MSDETIPASIRWKIKECLSVISNTIMAEVKGARVIPVRKATIPPRITTLVSLGVKFIQPEITDPTLAPAESAGAKIPPAPPEVKDNAGPIILKIGIYQSSCLSSVKSVRSIISFPEPRISRFTKKANDAIIKAEMIRKIILLRSLFSLFFQELISFVVI